MRNITEFQIIGRVGQVKTIGSTVRVSLAANYPVKDKAGDWKDNPHWNASFFVCPRYFVQAPE